MKKQIVKFAICLSVAALLVFLDQWTKSLAVANLKDAADVVLIPNVLLFRYVENQGMAFGLLQGAQVFFTISTGIVLLLILFLMFRVPLEKRYYALLTLMTFIMGGAVGNFIDRITNGYVVDFIYFRPIDFPVFNVADCFVTVGTILLAAFILFYYKDAELTRILPFKKKEKKEEP